MSKFSNRKQPAYEADNSMEPVAQRTSTTFIGNSIKIKGNIVSNEAIILEGKIDGNITINEKITIGKNGQFKGKIKAETVQILGKAKGEISASHKVEICSNGDFDGNVQSKKLIIEDGAIFNGNASMKEEEVPQKETKTPPDKKPTTPPAGKVSK